MVELYEELINGNIQFKSADPDYKKYDPEEHDAKYGGKEGFTKHFMKKLFLERQGNTKDAATAHVEYMIEYNLYEKTLKEQRKSAAPEKLSRTVTHKSVSVSEPSTFKPVQIQSGP